MYHIYIIRNFTTIHQILKKEAYKKIENNILRYKLLKFLEYFSLDPDNLFGRWKKHQSILRSTLP